MRFIWRGIQIHIKEVPLNKKEVPLMIPVIFSFEPHYWIEFGVSQPQYQGLVNTILSNKTNTFNTYFHSRTKI